MCLLLESIKICNNSLQNIEYHNYRFNKTRKKLFGICEKSKLENIIHIPELDSDIVYKCRVVYAVMIEKIEFITYNPKSITSLKCVYTNDIDYSFKYTDRSIINSLLKQKSEADEILIIKDNRITDTSISNVAFYDGKKWITPVFPLLKGTKRQQLIKNKIITEVDIYTSDLKKFRKARLFNAMIDWEASRDILIKNVNL